MSDCLSICRHACLRNSFISWTCAFFYSFLCNRNSLDGLMYFFRFEKKFIFSFSYCFNIYLRGTRQLDLCNFSDLKKKIIFLWFLHLCNRNSLAGLVHISDLNFFLHFFIFSYYFYICATESH